MVLLIITSYAVARVSHLICLRQHGTYLSAEG
jgi:hypothetical protein